MQKRPSPRNTGPASAPSSKVTKAPAAQPKPAKPHRDGPKSTKPQAAKPAAVKPPAVKPGLHPRNKYTGRYDFKALIECSPGLAKYVSLNAYQNESIDFANPDAVRALNRALLQLDYGITGWSLPPQFLCPPIPGRADYIHHLADLLALANVGDIPRGPTVRVLDIGVGANCIYPLIGHSEYGWQFVGSDIEEPALKSAQASINANSDYREAIELRLQANRLSIFQGVIQPDEVFDVSLCNPPFHGSLEEANAGTARKLNSLARASGKPAKHLAGKKSQGKNLDKACSQAADSLTLNFGGQYAELCCKGGEEGFISRMIAESRQFQNNCLWFTTLVSKASNLPALSRTLKEAGVVTVKTIDMAQGQKVSRILAWTFLTHRQHQAWRERQNSVMF